MRGRYWVNFCLQIASALIESLEAIASGFFAFLDLLAAGVCALNRFSRRVGSLSLPHAASAPRS
nr:MAG TPA: hypothetical protein [Caudoviricetes sp.]